MESKETPEQSISVSRRQALLNAGRFSKYVAPAMAVLTVVNKTAAAS